MKFEIILIIILPICFNYLIVVDIFSTCSVHQSVLCLWCDCGSGEEKAGVQLFESDAFEEGVLLKCFRCDLGFWDACFTTKTTCEAGERCYTGKGKAGVLVRIVFFLSECLFI